MIAAPVATPVPFRSLAMPGSLSPVAPASARFRKRTVFALTLLVLSACGGESISGPPPAPAAVRIDAGNTQEGIAGQQLPVRIAVTVIDENGRPLPDARVSFNVSPGGGTLNPASTQTNSAGRAESQWTLGSQTGTAVATANVSGVAPATFTAVVRPGPVSQVIASPNSLTLGVGDTLRLTATARDQFGNTIDQIALAWSSADPSVISVANGLVTAVSQGTGRAVVTTNAPSGTIADTVAIAVGPSGSSFCGTREVAVPPVGGVIFLNNSGGSAERCVGATVAGAEFTLVLMNASPVYGNSNGLDALALGVGTPPSASVSDAFGMSTSTLASGVSMSTPAASRDGGFERQLRLRERRELEPYTNMARERFGRDGRAAASVTGGGAVAAQVNPPAVGSFVTLNAQALSACSQPNMRTGRVVAVSQRAVIVADTANPSGGYTDSEYESIAVTFDTLTYPLDVEYFGEPTNVSGFNRIILFYTRAVNQLTPPNANYVVGGFFFARDLYPRQTRGGVPGCSNSNEREMMYLLVADPTGQVNSNARSKNDVTRLNRTTVAHELEHLINAGQRLYVTPNATTNEEVWLDEGLAHTAEELLYLRTAGFGTRENLRLSDIAPNSQTAQIFTNYAAQNFARWVGYLRAPESQSPYAPNDSLSTRGAAWHFLRYAAGRQPQNEAAFYRKLVGGPGIGIANLTAAIPGGELKTWLRDWAVANFADDLAANLDPRYTVPTWNFRSILPSLSIGGQTLGSYPLATRSLPSNVARRVNLAGGGSGYLRFSVPAARSALISVSFNGQAPPDDVQLAIVRYR